MRKAPVSSREHLLLALIISCFCVACLYKLGRYVTIDNDEPQKALIAIRLCAMLRGQSPMDLHALWIGTSPPPVFPGLMFNIYTGCGAFYAAVPVMLLAGTRLGTFWCFKSVLPLYGALIIFCVHYCVRRAAGPMAAMLSAFFLAINTSFIMSVRNAYFREEIFQLAGLWSGLALIAYAWEKKKKAPLYAAFFVFGLSLWFKIIFIAHMAAMTAALAAAGKKLRQKAQARMAFGRRDTRLCAAAFSVGAMPFLLYNAFTRMDTLRIIFDALFHPVRSCAYINTTWDNWNLPVNLTARLADLYVYLSGRLCNYIWTEPLKHNLLMPAMCAAALCWAFVCVFDRSGDKAFRRKLAALLAAGLTVIIAICPVIGSHSTGHILMLAPFCEILCALFAASWFGPGRGRKTAHACLLALVLAGWTFENGRNTRACLNIMKNSSCRYMLEPETRKMAARIREFTTPNALVLCPPHYGYICKMADPKANVRILDANDPELKAFLNKTRHRPLYAAVEETDALILDNLRAEGLHPRRIGTLLGKTNSHSRVSLFRLVGKKRLTE